MTFSAYYGVGTVTVAAGGTAVTGSGTLWSALLQPGDTFEAAGRAVRILDVIDDTHLTLAYGWPGTALAASAYLVVYNAPARSSGTYVAERARELIERQRILDDGIPTYAAKAAGTVTPPATPVASDLYLIGGAPTGVWAGYAGYLAVATDAGGWRFTAPEQGMRVYDTTADAVWERHSAGWVNIAPISASLLGAANGVATLDSGGKIPTAQLPALAITDVFTVATQAAMLALTAQTGDIAIRTDLNKTFVLAASPATTLANWAEVLAPTAAVLSVAGKTGAVTLVKADVGLGNVDNTSDVNKPVSTAQATAIADAVTEAQTNASRMQGWRNRLINGEGRINQRGATSQADDTYAWDRWTVLTQTGAVGISSLSDVADGVPSLMRMTQSQATAQRMGYLQVIEGKYCKDMRGANACLSGKVRASAALTVRYAILAWTGTEDTVTSDVVLSWTSTTFAAGGFFLASNVSVVQQGSLALAANTLTDLPALIGTMPSALNNALVMLWTDAAAAQNVTLDCRMQLEAASIERPFEVRPFGTELAMCQRYYQISPALPGTWGSSTTQPSVVAAFIVSMRAAPTIGLVNGSINGGSALEVSVAQRAITAIGTVTANAYGARWDITTAAAGGTYRVCICEAGAFSFSAEI